jgi:hypothetical protein
MTHSILIARPNLLTFYVHLTLIKLILFAWLRASAAKQVTAAAFLYSFFRSPIQYLINLIPAEAKISYKVWYHRVYKPWVKKKNSHLHGHFDPWHCYAVSKRRAWIAQWRGTIPQKNGDLVCTLRKRHEVRKCSSLHSVSWFKTCENAKSMWWCIERGSFMATYPQWMRVSSNICYRGAQSTSLRKELETNCKVNALAYFGQCTRMCISMMCQVEFVDHLRKNTFLDT